MTTEKDTVGSATAQVAFVAEKRASPAYSMLTPLV